MAEFVQSSLVVANINLRLSLEFSNAEINESSVEISSSEVRVSISS